MYYLLAALGSALIAISLVLNGQLTLTCDVYASSTIIHLAGFILISIILLVKREHPLRLRHIAPALFTGGAIGVCTTMFNNAAYGKISVAAILALGLLAQAITSLVIDHFGFFHMPIRKFNYGKLAGFLCTMVGIIILMRGSAILWIPIILSLLTGISIVTSRSVNAELADKTTPLISTWYNYAVGLMVCLLLWTGAVGSGHSSFHIVLSKNPLVYTGGLVGVAVIFLLNITVKKMPAFIMTLIMFIGQMFTGILLDVFLGSPLSFSQLLGGVLTLLGLILNLWLDYRKAGVSR